MNNQSHEFSNLPQRLKGLGNLAENLWWSWNPGARMLFKMLDRQLWKESRHNNGKNGGWASDASDKAMRTFSRLIREKEGLQVLQA